jgi:4-amino-4-deoxy-L-arabinose transferase-like glycosyltransferase
MDAAPTLNASKQGSRFGWRVTPFRLAAGLTLLALTLRLTNLGGRALWLDEAFSQWFSDRSYHYLWTVLPTYEAHPPFFYTVLKTWRWLVGEGHFAMRGLSALAGTLTVLVAMGIAWEQERDGATGRPLLRAGIAGFLCACSPLFMVIGQEARPYPLLTLAYTGAILALFRLVRQFRTGEAGSWPSWLLFGFTTALTCWFHALGILYGACLALALLPAWLAAPVGRDRIVRGVLTAAAVAAAYLPCLIMITGRAADWSTNWLVWHPAMLFYQLLALYTVPVEALSIGSAIAALAMVLLIKRALVTTWASKGWNSDRLLLLLWLGPPMLASLISALYEPVFLARTLSGTLVPCYLMIAGAIARSDSGRERRLISAAICATLLPTAIWLALRGPVERWDLLSEYLSRNVSAQDQVWLYPADSALPLDAVGTRVAGKIRAIPEPFPTLRFKGPIRAGWPAVVSLTPQQAVTFANDPKLKDVPVIWLVTRQSGIFDPHDDMPSALAEVRRAGPLTEWGYITVRPYTRR